MASNLDDLKTIRDSMIARLKEILASPKPSYSIDGVSYQFTAYQRMLIDKLETINALIISCEGPVSSVDVAVP